MLGFSGQPKSDKNHGGRNKQISENEEEIRIFYCLGLKNEEEIRIFYCLGLKNEEEIRIFYCLGLKIEEEIRRRMGKKLEIFTPTTNC